MLHKSEMILTIQQFSSIQMIFLWKVIRQNDTNLTSFFMQFEKVGCGLLQKAFQSEGSGLLAEREGGK